MRGRTHALTGLLIGVAMVRFLSLPTLDSILVVTMTVLGALVADLDTVKSTLGRRVLITGWIFSHRSFFHSPIFLIVTSLVVYALFPRIVAIGFALGFVSHLLLDSTTPQGIRVPGVRRALRGPVRTGSLAEKTLFIAELAVLILLLASNNIA